MRGKENASEFARKITGFPAGVPSRARLINPDRVDASERASEPRERPAFARSASARSRRSFAEAEARRRSGARESVWGSSAIAKATADIAEALAEACRGAQPLG